MLDTDPEAIEPGPERKAFAELGIAIRIALGHPPPGATPSLRALARHWLSTAARRRIFFDPVRRVQLVPHMAINLATAVALGAPSTRVRLDLQRAVDLLQLERTELPVWLRQNLSWHFDVAGLTHEFPPIAELTRQSLLARPPSLALASTDDMYALTHIVFALASFGDRSVDPFMPGEPRDRIAAYAGVALSTCLAERNWDLVGEWLLVRLYLCEATALDREAATALVRAQDPSGFIPALAQGDPTDEAGDAALFQRVYHPTLVALIVLAACEQRNRVAAAPG